MLRKKINTTGGISQQPNSLRLPNQVTSCNNFYTNHLLQTVRRKGMQHIKELANGDTLTATDQYYLWEVRGNKYLVVVLGSADGGTVTTGRVRVYNLATGAQINVIRTPANYDYTVPSSGNRSDNIKLVEDGEDLYILNKTQNPRLKTTLSTGTNNAHYVFLKQGNYNTDYRIKVRFVHNATTYDVSASVRTWNGQTIIPSGQNITRAQQDFDGISFSPTQSQPSGGLLGSIKTEDIIQQLKTNLEDNISYVFTGGGQSGGAALLDYFTITDSGLGYSYAPTINTVNGAPGYVTGTASTTIDQYLGDIKTVTNTATGGWMVNAATCYRLAYVDGTAKLGTGNKPVGIPVLDPSAGTMVGATTLENGTWKSSGTFTWHLLPAGNNVDPNTSYPAGTGTVNANLQISGYTITSPGIGLQVPTAAVIAAGPTFIRAANARVNLKNYAIGITRLGFDNTQSVTTNSYLGSILKLTANAGVTITSVETSDSLGNTVLEVVGPKAPRVQGYLPEEFENGVVIEIMGDGEASEDNYFVKFETISGQTFGKGHWIETLKPTEVYQIDNTTMPHKLTWNSTGDLVYNTVTWSDRLVGEIATVPNPSIVFNSLDMNAEPIRDMIVYKDRLCFINKKSLVMSETGRHTNIWRTTMLQVLDTDPIDLDVGDRLNSLVEYPIGLIAFTDNDQTVIRGSDVLSPRTVEVQVVSNWDNIAGNNISPVDSGTSLFFLTQNGSFCGAKEMTMNPQGLPQIMEITSAVPNLIPSTPTLMTASAPNGMFIVKSSANNNILYVYRYMGKALSAWVTWTLSPYHNIVQIKIVDNLLHVTYLNNGHTCIGTINLTEDSSIARYFDKYITLSGGTYNAGENKTTYNLATQTPATSFDTNDALGSLDIVNNIFYQVEKVTTTSIKLAGNTTAKTILFGTGIVASIELTKPYFSEDVTQSLRGLNIYYNNTNQLTLSHTAGNRVAVSYGIAQPTTSETTSVALKTGNEFVPITGDPAKATITLSVLGYGHPVGLEVLEYLYILQRRG